MSQVVKSVGELSVDVRGPLLFSNSDSLAKQPQEFERGQCRQGWSEIRQFFCQFTVFRPHVRGEHRKKNKEQQRLKKKNQ